MAILYWRSNGSDFRGVLVYLPAPTEGRKLMEIVRIAATELFTLQDTSRYTGISDSFH